MKQVEGNLWDYHDSGQWIGIPTNLSTTTQGLAVMGRGLAREARIRFPLLSAQLGNHIQNHKTRGSALFWFFNLRIVCVPVKHEWRNPASLNLIRVSCTQLTRETHVPELYLPKLGCGYGQRTWEEVGPVMREELGDQFTVVSLKGDKDDQL